MDDANLPNQPGGQGGPQQPNPVGGSSGPRVGLPGPLGIPPIPSRAALPPLPPLPDVGTPAKAAQAAVAADAAAIVGFDVPPVEQVVAAVNEATDIVARVQAQIRTVLSTGVAMADAIQGRISAGVLQGLRDAVAAGEAACQGVHQCIVQEALGAIGAVDSWLMTLPLPQAAQDAIVAELGAIFGPGWHAPTPAQTGGAISASPSFCGPGLTLLEGACVRSPEPGSECQIGFDYQPGSPCGPPLANPRPPVAPPHVPGPPPPHPALPIAPGVSYQILTTPCGTFTIPSGWAYVQPGVVAPPGTKLVSGFPVPGSTLAADYWGVPSCSPPNVWADNGSGNYSCDNPYACSPPLPPPPNPPTPQPPQPPPPQPCPCVTCKCDPCQCPKPEDSCGPGTHWDSATKKCVPDKPQRRCPEGYYWDNAQEKCVKREAHQYCVYCRASDQSTYLVEQGETPDELDDYILACYESLADVPPKDEWPECEQLPEEEVEAIEPGLFPSGGPWCTLSICEGVPSFGVTLPLVFGPLGRVVESLVAPEAPANFAQSFENIPAILRPFVQLLASGGNQFVQMLGSLLQSFATAADCGSPAFFNSWVISALIGLCERWVSTGLAELDISNRYYRHLVCPQLTLTPEQATAAYLANAIDDQTLRCLVQANNNCWEPWAAYLESQRSKPSPGELAQLRRREVLNEDQYREGMRRIGYTDQGDSDNLYKLTTQIPFVSDLLRMMVRDAADDTIPAWAESDRTFIDKWKGQVKAWGDQQGVEDLYAKYVWRAHWTLPSPTQLYNLYHRLRKQPAPAGYATWEEAIEQVLVQQDILPTWVKPLIDVSFHPLTATDIVRAYSVGSIDEQGVTDGYSQLGYSDDNAEALTKFRRRERIEQARLLPQAKLYLDDGMSKTDFVNYLTSRNYPQPDIDEIVSLLDQRKGGKTRAVCIASLKKRYMKGELSAADLLGGLVGLGVEDVEANNLVARYSCEFASRDPHVGIRLLIPLYKKHIINVAEFLRRAGNLGILPDLAGRIIQQMDAELGDAAAAAQAKRLRQAERLALQNAKAAARAQKAAAAAAEKAAKQAQAAARQAAQLRKSIDATILKAIKAGASEQDATAVVNQAIGDIESAYGASPAEAAAIATLAVETTSPWSQAAFHNSIQLAIDEHLAAVPGTG